jgi:hypothetical protein
MACFLKYHVTHFPTSPSLLIGTIHVLHFLPQGVRRTSMNLLLPFSISFIIHFSLLSSLQYLLTSVVMTLFSLLTLLTSINFHHFHILYSTHK